MKKSIYLFLTAGLLTFGMATFSSCDSPAEERAEENADQIEEAGEERGEAIEDAAENKADAMEEAADDMDTTVVVE